MNHQKKEIDWSVVIVSCVGVLLGIGAIIAWNWYFHEPCWAHYQLPR
jgi:hypothetical protein